LLNLTRSSLRRILIMGTLIASGEAIFLLPFVVARIFRPTLLDVLDINNFQLGIAFSVYGIVAMFAYFAGGPLADRYPARRLMTIALVFTGIGGILFAGKPTLNVLIFLYGFWGVTTILIFWAALIRATREWGGKFSQGRAFGILDGGRGFVTALLASVSVSIFAALLPESIELATIEQRTSALNYIIWIFTGIVFITGLFVWIFIPESSSTEEAPNYPKLARKGIQAILRRPAIWLQAVIVLCAYVGYKGTDDFSLYAYDALGYDDVEAARIGTISFWMRPFAAIGAGLLADLTKPSHIGILSFAILLLGSSLIALGKIPPGSYWFLVVIVAGTSIGIYALRGVYFALFQEAHIPMTLTGSAVGLVSVVGYTPDIFMGPLMGYLIDRSPGALGHQHVFGVLAVFAFIGLLSTFAFQKITQKNQ